MDITKKLIQRVEKTHLLYLCTILFFVVFLIYSNTLGNGLFFDDEDFVYKNTYVETFALDKYFTDNVIAGAGKVSNYYRPLLLISYGIEHALFGYLPFIYHLDNILIHAAASIALFLFLDRLLKRRSIAFLATLFFAVHPVQTEAVSYISGRNDPMAAFFMFLTLFFYLKKTTRSLLFASISFLFGLLSRETAIVTPALIFAVEVYQTKSLKKAFSNFTTMLPFILIASLYFFLRLTVLNFQNTLNFYSAETIYSSHLHVRLLTFLSILPTYASLLFFPLVLHMEREAAIVTTAFSVPVLASFFILILLSILALKYLKQLPVLAFSLLWFLITIAPTSGIIPINGIIYEHFLFLPLIGIFLFLSFLLVTTTEKIKNPIITTLLLFLVCSSLFFYSTRTFLRNFDWHDPITFYEQLITYNPNVARVYNNLAMAYSENGQTDEAIQTYKKAVQVGDFYAETHYNLANAYLAQNNSEAAEKEYKEALRINPFFLRSYVQLAFLYKQEQRNEDLEYLLEELAKKAEMNEEIRLFTQHLKTELETVK